MEMSLSEALEDVAFSASGKRQHVYVTRHGGALDAKDLHMQHGDPQLSPTGEVAAAELAESLANAEPRPLHELHCASHAPKHKFSMRACTQTPCGLNT